jgi:hypothetical protein
MRILPQHDLVLLELRPGQVALVVIADQHVPGRHRAAVTTCLAGAPLNHAGAIAAAPERVSSGVNRVL